MNALTPHSAATAPRLSVVICTLDEAATIAAVLREAAERLAAMPHEIVVVDDSDDDLTARAVLAVQRLYPQVRLIRRQERGLASAAIAGWTATTGELLAVMDGDGQHDPALLPALVEALEAEGADIAVGSRYLDGASGLTGFRAGLSVAGTWLTGVMLGARLADPLSGLFLMRRDWFEAARPRLAGVGFKILVDVIASGPRRPVIAQRPTALRPRGGGTSKLDVRVVADLLALLVEKRTGGVLSARFALFAAVGASGVVCNLLVLGGLTSLRALPFAVSAAVATLAAMVWNFVLNNLLTFRDRRLRGAALGQGLILFCLACAGGAVLAEVVSVATHRFGAPWFAAGMLGALSSGAWNYAVGARAAWRTQRRGGDPARKAALVPGALR